MKRMLIVTVLFVVQGCSLSPPQNHSVAGLTCAGSTLLPPALISHLDAVIDESLLQSALGEPDQGKLCQGQVYQTNKSAKVTVFRAWNSTNPNSQYGQWWAFNKPTGKIATYRADYEICYQWSPLDKMTRCTLKPNTKVVVGNGQSAICSDYLSYPTSQKQQVYIVDAHNAVENCTEYDGVMSWQ